MSFIWKYVKAFLNQIGKWCLKYPIQAAITVFVIIAAICLAGAGKKFQIGGILGKLWGKSKEPNSREVVPPERKDEEGKPIQPGESDEKGYVQAPVVAEIEEPGMFSNPDKIVVNHPEKGKVKIDLPKGVKNTSVREVVEISPDVYEVKNNDKGVDTTRVLEILGSK